MDYAHLDSLLKKSGLSRRQLAIMCGISPGTMSNWFFRKTKKVPLKYVFAIANCLGVEWHEIMLVDEIAPGIFSERSSVQNGDDTVQLFDQHGSPIGERVNISETLLTENEEILLEHFRQKTAPDRINPSKLFRLSPGFLNTAKTTARMNRTAQNEK